MSTATLEGAPATTPPEPETTPLSAVPEISTPDTPESYPDNELSGDIPGDYAEKAAEFEPKNLAEAREALRGFSRIILGIRNGYNKVIEGAKETLLDNPRLGLIEDRKGQLKRAIDARQRKINRRKKRADRISSPIIKEYRLRGVEKLESEVKDRKTRLGELNADANSITAHRAESAANRESALLEAATERVQRRQDKLAKRHFNRELRRQGYNFFERRILNDTMKQKQQRQIGGLALELSRLNGREAGAQREHQVVESKYNRLTDQLSQLHAEYERNPREQEAIELELESLAAQAEELRDKLDAYDSDETTKGGGYDNAIVPSDLLKGVEAKQQELQLELRQKQLRYKKLASDIDVAERQLPRAKAEHDSSRDRLNRQLADLKARRAIIDGEIKSITRQIIEQQ